MKGQEHALYRVHPGASGRGKALGRNLWVRGGTDRRCSEGFQSVTVDFGLFCLVCKRL